MILDFFGANITDGYVENNSEYASMYKEVLNKNIKTGKGYVSLERLLYFYLENNKLSFDMIYEDNLDSELKQVKPISDVCKMNRYSIYSVCNNIEESNQINEIQNKPFSYPLDISNLNITSFFMEERIIYGKENIHTAWDFSADANSKVYAVCDGEVITNSFKYDTNTINKEAGAGNYITIKCDDEENNYEVLYGHLYPNSSKVKVGSIVKKGDHIAGVGTTGYSTGNHLHFQVSQNGKYVDGLSLVDFSSISTPFDINHGTFR